MFINCGATKTDAVDTVTKYANTITKENLKELLYVYASDEFEGRDTGEPGQKKAVEFLKKFYVDHQITSPLGSSDYFQKVPSKYLSNNRRGLQLKDSENVVAFIKGSEKPDEIVIISAHLDHEGIKNGKVYNGADDDGSGTVAILEMAEAFKKATEAGHGLKKIIKRKKTVIMYI